jgi:hypothetical protein
MGEVIELKKYKRPNVVVNPELDKYSKDIINPEKLARIHERLEKHPLPAWFSLSVYSKIQQEHGFEVTGVLKRADATKNTFFLIELENEMEEMHYTIRTEPDTLNNLVKAFWGAPIKVHIRPQITDDNLFLFELIEVKVD